MFPVLERVVTLQKAKPLVLFRSLLYAAYFGCCEKGLGSRVCRVNNVNPAVHNRIMSLRTRKEDSEERSSLDSG